jgi:RNA polymerase sigma-70 factor (ECF subfamily)
MDETSSSLLIRVRNPQDRAAWERFVQLYTPLLLAWARFARIPASDANDLVQEVLVHLLRKLPKFHYNGQGTFRAWLKTVANHKWRDLLHKRRENPLSPDDERVTEVADDPTPAFWEKDYQRLLYGRALELMQREFEEKTWRACLETAVRQRKAADVAQELGMTPAAVYQARSRVLRRLREEFQELID